MRSQYKHYWRGRQRETTSKSPLSWRRFTALSPVSATLEIEYAAQSFLCRMNVAFEVIYSMDLFKKFRCSEDLFSPLPLEKIPSLLIRIIKRLVLVNNLLICTDF